MYQGAIIKGMRGTTRDIFSCAMRPELAAIQDDEYELKIIKNNVQYSMYIFCTRSS